MLAWLSSESHWEVARFALNTLQPFHHCARARCDDLQSLASIHHQRKLRLPRRCPLLTPYTAQILANESEDGEVAYRSIVALGNLVHASGSLPVGDVQVSKELASNLANQLKEQRLKQVAEEINA